MSAKNNLRHFAAVCARTFHLWPLISRSGLYNYARHKKYPNTLVYLDIVITECCTLRCRNCSNLMQYYHDPENLAVDLINRTTTDYLEYRDGAYYYKEKQK